MGLKNSFALPLGAASIAALVLGATASADISPIVFTITAESSLGRAEYTAAFDPTYWEEETQQYNWSLSSPVSLMSDTGALIAQLGTARVYCREDPQVDLNFSVFAGSVNTVFTITSPTLSFGTIAESVGRTSAGFTISDLDGDGVSMDGWNGNSIYTSRYNGAVPGGTTFHDSFLGSFGTPIPGDTATGDDTFPFTPIAGAVSDMSSRFRFTLTANDIASGTSVYEILPVPAPSAVTLLGLGGILVARRRR